MQTGILFPCLKPAGSRSEPLSAIPGIALDRTARVPEGLGNMGSSPRQPEVDPHSGDARGKGGSRHPKRTVFRRVSGRGLTHEYVGVDREEIGSSGLHERAAPDCYREEAFQLEIRWNLDDQNR